MKRHVPLREVAHLRLTRPADERWIDTLSWLPVSTTEIYLACRYYPLAVRVEALQPQLGLIVDQRYVTHALVDPNGKWRGAYRPIAVRCFPFQAPQLDDDPLSDIVIDADSTYLSKTVGLPFVSNDRVESWLTELHRLFRLLKRSDEGFARVLDQYLIAGLFEPLAGADPARPIDDPSLYIANPARFAGIGTAALGAMGRPSFLGVDVMMACLFSLQNLKAEYRPKNPEQHGRDLFLPAVLAPDPIVINDVPLALDDGELVSLSHVGAV